MEFIPVGSEKEMHHIAKDQIGHLAVISSNCDKCGADHYVLEVYDRNNNLLCSVEDSKPEIEKKRKDMLEELKSNVRCRLYCRFCKGGIVVCRRRIR